MLRPNSHRTALLTWIVVYPLITGLLALLEPVMGRFAMPVRTLILTAIMAPTMVYVAMPIANRLLDVLIERYSPYSTDQYRGPRQVMDRCHHLGPRRFRRPRTPAS